MNKIFIIDENDINALISQAILSERELTFSTEKSQMLVLNFNGVCINSTPRKDGRFQGYLVLDGLKRYFYGKSREEVAEKIKQAITKPKPNQNQNITKSKPKIPTTFSAFALYHFENFRKKKVADATYKVDLRRLKKYLLPTFKETPLKAITPKDCQDILESQKVLGKSKTAEELYSLLSIIFKSAIKHGVLVRNPLDLVIYEKHERKNGKALTIEEERRFKAKIRLLTDERVKHSLFLMLYTGLRPNELKTARVENGFIVAVNSKRHSKKVEYKRIPVIDALKPYIHYIEDMKTPNLDLLRVTVKDILPSHKLYDLRTTFYTRCKEFGVSDYARDYFVGHSSGVLANTYTDFSDEYLLKEAEKLNAWK